MNVRTTSTTPSTVPSSITVPQAGVRTIDAIPARITIRSTGSERASTSRSSVSASAANTPRGAVSTFGTRLHQVRAAASPAAARCAPARSAACAGLRRSLTPRAYVSPMSPGSAIVRSWLRSTVRPAGAERGEPQVLRRVRRAAPAVVPVVPHGEPAGRQVLRGVRDPTGGARRASGRDCGCTPGRAAAGVRPVRGPRRVHGRLGRARRRGHAGAPVALFRHISKTHRAVRRDGGEVHRRCGDGRLGNAGRDRGRCRARRPCRARHRRRRHVARGRGRRSRPSRTCRGADRRGRCHDRRERRGHGRRRSRQHGVPRAVSGRTGNGVRGRVDAARDRADDRVLRGRRVRAQGQRGAHAALAGAARRLRRARNTQVDRSRGAVRRPRRRVAQDQGPLPHLRRGGPCTPRLGHGHRGHRQVAPRMGVLQVLRRAAAAHVLASRPLPGLRGRGRVLGAGRHGADALPNRRRRRPGHRPREARGGAGGASAGRERALVRRATPRATARARRGGDPRPARPFAAWRLFFERLAEVYPTVLAFEDMQWADASLLDFVEHLLDWSRNHSLYVITLARPELVERRPTWGAGQRNFTSIYLDPLSEEAMGDLLDGLVPGLPAGAREQILARAEGVPLYAVETVRMLLDRGDLVQDGPVYRPAREIGSLDVPETLHALIAARLDGLSPDERRLLQDGAVLGKTFTERGLAALDGNGRADLGPLLAGLVRKEVLSLQTDPRSPEHGQYGFLQDLVRHVAYETLARRERRTRHLAAAAYLEQSLGEDEVAEVIAAHYVAAFEAAPDAEDASEIRAKARDALTRAGERATALAASAEAHRYFRRAAEFTEGPHDEATLLDRAGQAALRANDPAAARELLERAQSLFGDVDTQGAALVSAKLAELDFLDGHSSQAVTRLESALQALAGAEPDANVAAVAGQLGRFLVLNGQGHRGLPYVEQALELAE